MTFLRHLSSLLCCLPVAVGLLVAAPLTGQRTVNLLRTDGDLPVPAVVTSVSSDEAESFEFERNLIFFEAEVDGRPGSFILDTGAPSLVMNNRGQSASGSRFTGLGSGGQVSLTDHRVGHFEMLGRSIDNYWAIGVDLRDMESRTGKRIDGFVGYDLVNGGELRIDYVKQSFRLLPSSRRPAHEGAAPRAVLRFTLVDHLPVIQIKVNGRRYRFAIDTGAGLNLLAKWAEEELPTTADQRTINVLGLDGAPVDCPAVSLAAPDKLSAGGDTLELVTTDLSHLAESGQTELAGILGSPFLSRFVVGIDYRRQKIYLW